MQGKKGKFGCFTDDGFAIGVAYILSVLKQVRIPPEPLTSGLCCGLTTRFLWRAQNGKFESLHWFDSLTDEFREQERQLAELGRGAGRGGEKDQDMAQHALRMRKLRNRKAEFDLLYYAFNGARIFFRGEGAKVVAPSETAL